MNSTSSPRSTPGIQDEVIARGVGWFVLVLGLTILTLSSLVSCNTTRGFGRDMQRVGNTIERTAAGR